MSNQSLLDKTCFRVEANFDAEVAFLSRLVQTPSVHLEVQDEERCQDLIAGQLAPLGLRLDRFIPDWEALHALRDPITGESLYIPSETLRTNYLERRDRSNLVAVLPAGRAGGRSLLLNGHIDVVPPGDLARWSDAPFSGAVRNGRLFGRGASDQKAGVAAMVFAAQAVVEAGDGLAGDVVLEFVVDEETGGNGTLACMQRGYRGDAAIFTEPTDGKIYTAHVGGQLYEISVKGRAAHPSQGKGVDAIETMYKVIRRLRQWEQERSARIRAEARRRGSAFANYETPARISINTIHGGEYMNIAAETVRIQGGIRSAPWETMAGLRAECEEVLRRMGDDDAWLREQPPAAHWGLAFPGSEIAPESAIVRELVAATERANGTPAPATALNAGCDVWIYSRVAGVPTVLFGPGEMALGHGPDESVTLEDLRSATRALAALMVEWCGRRE
jgi:acetylornithine deacetylase